ncbi:MAG: enoyl-CoA hydratase-related protein [Bacteroidota bacterium]|nr:enoyl-CoA hydratase-related protein [Bacteroidota bacterium]
MEFVLTRKNEAAFEIILNRPDKRNALNSLFVTELKEAYRLANNDDTVRTVVLKANGPVFSAGADLAYLQQLQSNSHEENLADSTNLMELFELMYYHKKVLVAQVEGTAVAGGCGLVSACDFVFSVPEAKFGYTEVKIGFVPAIVMFFLIRKLGEARARQLMLTGELADAEKALEIGMVTEIVPQGLIGRHVEEFTRKIAADTSGQSIALTRRMMADMQHLSPVDALRYAAAQNAAARASDDCKKGIRAFLNKEKPDWG